jgi:hypothetical protein
LNYKAIKLHEVGGILSEMHQHYQRETVIWIDMVVGYGRVQKLTFNGLWSDEMVKAQSLTRH